MFSFKQIVLICSFSFIHYAYFHPPTWNVGYGTTGAVDGGFIQQKQLSFRDKPFIPSCSANVKITQLSDSLLVGADPFYDEETNSVYFVDGPASTVYRYCVNTNGLYFAKLGERHVNNIIPIKSTPGKFLITYGDELCIMSWDGMSRSAGMECVRETNPSYPWPENFVNDAKVAPNGALFFYSDPVNEMPDVTSLPRGRATLFSIVDGKQKTLITNLSFGKGLGWSPDGRWFYHSDAVQNVTYKSFYNEETNSLGDTRLLLNHTLLNTPGTPLSLTVDAEGYVWIGKVEGSEVLKVDPNSGHVICSVKLPASGVTNVSFGKCPNTESKKLKCLYATSGGLNLRRSKVDGAFFLVKGLESEGFLPHKLDLSTLSGIRFRWGH